MKLNPLSKQSVRVAIIMGILALTVRLTFVSFYSPAQLAGGDPKAFKSFAEGIVEGHGFRSTVEPWLADRPPLYVFFLAANFLVFGENETAIFVVQSVLGAIASGLFFLCCVRLFEESSALIGGALFSTLPHFLLFTKQVLTESLYISLLVFLLASLLLPKEKRFRIHQWFLVGFVLGLTALCRREALLPAGIMVLSLSYVLLERDMRKWAKAIAAVVICLVMTLSPWVIRNWVVIGSPMLSSSGGWNFLVGNNPLANGGYTAPPPDWAAEFIGVREIDWSSLAWSISLDWIHQHPVQFLGLLPKKLYRFYGPSNNWLIDMFEIALIPLYALGFLRVARREGNWQGVIAIVAPFLTCLTLVALIFVGGWRYRLALYPGLLLLASHGLPQHWIEPVLGRVRSRLFSKATATS